MCEQACPVVGTAAAAQDVREHTCVPAQEGWLESSGVQPKRGLAKVCLCRERGVRVSERASTSKKRNEAASQEL